MKRKTRPRTIKSSTAINNPSNLWLEILFAVSCLLVVGLGLISGEKFISLYSAFALGSGGAVALAVVFRFLKRKTKLTVWPRAGILLLLLALSWAGGGLDLENALQDCQRHSDQLRKDLVLYKERAGWYPVSLDQLGWGRLPGDRLIGKSVLHYDFGPDNFQLYFSPQIRAQNWRSCSNPRKK